MSYLFKLRNTVIILWYQFKLKLALRYELHNDVDIISWKLDRLVKGSLDVLIK